MTLTKQKRKTLRIHCPDGDKHTFQIIRGSGRRTGISTWMCKECNHKIKSS